MSALSFPALNLCRTERLSKRANRRSSVAPFPPATENPVFFPFSITGPDRWKNRQYPYAACSAGKSCRHAIGVATRLFRSASFSLALPAKFLQYFHLFPLCPCKKGAFRLLSSIRQQHPIPKTTGSPACGRYPTGSACAIGYFSA